MAAHDLHGPAGDPESSESAGYRLRKRSLITKASESIPVDTWRHKPHHVSFLPGCPLSGLDSGVNDCSATAQPPVIDS